MQPFSAVRPARREEMPAVFQLLFQHTEPTYRGLRVANALELVSRGELDAEGVLVVGRGNGLEAAILCLPVPGAGGLVWPPQAVAGADRADLEDQLVRSAGDWLRCRGARLGQALLPPTETSLAGPLLRNGFAHVTCLWYLRHRLDRPKGLPRPPDGLTYVTYDASEPALFHETLVRTYEETQDCPEVNGVRSVEEIIDGHRSQGLHDPGRWWLALDGGRPVGVLLLTELAGGDGWDISYVGVVPEARRQGFGRALTCKAIAEARAGGAGQLMLSVDTRNRPARDLYLDLGFEPYDEREVFLAIWSRAASP